MYPFLQLDDDTVIVHSELKPDNTVIVYVEKPDEKDCFHSGICVLPSYQWREIRGLTESDISRYQEIIESTAHLIIEFSQTGGIEGCCTL